MNVRALVLSITLSAAWLLAQQPQAPTVQTSEIQISAEALMEKARHLSDIRARNAPAFRLKATFSFIGKDLENRQGTYSEIWISDSQWRRETVVKAFHRIEVGTPNRTWTLDNSKDFPETAAKLPALMNIFPATPAKFEFEAITDTTDNNPPEICATTKPGPQLEHHRFCFDPKSGALLAKLSPDIRLKGASDYTCFYGIFRKLGDFWFPHEMACFIDKHRELEAKVDELAAEPRPTQANFKPPAGAVELGRCSGTSSEPVETLNPDPRFPTGAPGNAASVVLWLVVDTKGKPQHLRVTQSAGQGFDDQALATVKQLWRFQPGTCDGEPMPMAVGVTLKFRSGIGSAP